MTPSGGDSMGGLDPGPIATLSRGDSIWVALTSNVSVFSSNFPFALMSSVFPFSFIFLVIFVHLRNFSNYFSCLEITVNGPFSLSLVSLIILGLTFSPVVVTGIPLFFLILPYDTC